MAIKSLEQRKRQQRLLIVAIVIAVLAAGVLYFGFMGGISAPAPVAPGQEVPMSGAEILAQEKLKKIDLEADMVFLEEKIFSFFKGYGDLPVQKGETGRNNPFISY
jgi:hypothetical protein